MAITEQQSGGHLYDLTRPFVWLYRSFTAVNLVYKIQKRNVFGSWTNITGKIRQPREFGSLFNFYINPSEILADELITQIRAKNEFNIRDEFSASIQFRLILTEENVVNNLLVHEQDETLWFKAQNAYGIDAAIQHEETFGKAQNEWLDVHRIRVGTSINSVKFMTNKPVITTDMSVDDNEYIYAFNREKQIKLKISFLSINNSSIGSPIYSGFLVLGVNSIGIGVPNIIAQIGQSAWDAIASNVYKIRYVLLRSDFTEVTEVGEYFLNKDKCTNERLRVYWKNRRGGVDGYTFNGELSVSLNAKSKTTKNHLGYRRSNSENENHGDYIVHNTYGSQSRTIGSTNMVASESIQVTSRYHRQDELRWLSEIVTSPQIWIENLQTGQLNAVYSITRKATTKAKGKSLGQMKLSLRMSNEVMTQR
jgi:hypothetical protein|tara:strand:- start:11075 stop:12340 length:1266 start_codon:yes stop_codon:yes gene_type:complete